ncbi:MAG: hypothetical protein WEB60_02695, partial [Terrimicrobiaceae bacterium]
GRDAHAPWKNRSLHSEMRLFAPHIDFYGIFFVLMKTLRYGFAFVAAGKFHGPGFRGGCRQFTNNSGTRRRLFV